jgi:hypothetical protein
MPSLIEIFLGQDVWEGLKSLKRTRWIRARNILKFMSINSLTIIKCHDILDLFKLGLISYQKIRVGKGF